MPLLLLAIVVFTLAFVTPLAAAMDCRGATPLPSDLRITPPAVDVPAGVAAFAGGWSGSWTDPDGSGDLCTTLVVEEVLANAYARVVYSVGWAPKIGSGIPNFWRATGTISGDLLTFRLTDPNRPTLRFRQTGDTLAGTFQNSGSAALARATDVRVLDCRPSPRAVATPTGTRDRLTAAELMSPPPGSTTPVHNDYFLPVGAAAPPRHALRGVLTIPAFSVTPTRMGCPARPGTQKGFTVAFFTDGDRVVPVIRDIVPDANIILSPGRVWSEPGDGGLSRASFPLPLSTR